MKLRALFPMTNAMTGGALPIWATIGVLRSGERMLFMTVPTAASRPELLASLIDNCGLPRQCIVIVATKPGLAFPEGVVVLEDFESPNIQRWWARGITEAERRGATSVALVNDDVRLVPSTLTTLENELVRTGAAIASPSRPPFHNGLHIRQLVPFERHLSGCLWVLRLDSDLRPDQRYTWWYGDDDLDIRARRQFGGVVLAAVEFEHLHEGRATATSPVLQAMSAQDAQTFERQYASLLRMSRLIARRQRQRQTRKSTQAGAGTSQ